VKARVGWLVREAQPEDEERGEPGTTRSPIVTNSPQENKLSRSLIPMRERGGTGPRKQRRRTVRPPVKRDFTSNL